MEYVEQARSQDDSLCASELTELIKDQFGIDVHPRSLERALARRKKKERRNSGSNRPRSSTD